MLVLSNGEYVVVEFVQHEILEEPVKVYNFEVEDYHTYFVSESSVLVHNGCEDDNEPKISFRDMMSPEDAARYEQYWYNVGVNNAVKARDKVLADISTWSTNKRNQVATVVGGVNLDTGAVAVGIKNTRTHKNVIINGKRVCAEDLTVQQLGGNNPNIVMTSAIRPRNGEIIKVCKECQKIYSPNQFMEGVEFE